MPKAVIQCRDCDVNLGSPGCDNHSVTEPPYLYCLYGIYTVSLERTSQGTSSVPIVSAHSHSVWYLSGTRRRCLGARVPRGGKCPVAPHTGGNGRTAVKTPDDPSSCGTAETAERRRAVTGRGPAPRRTTPGRARRGRPGPPGSTCPRAEAARTAPAPPGRDRRRPLPTPSDESSPPSSGLNIETRDPSSSRVGDTLGGPHVDAS